MAGCMAEAPQLSPVPVAADVLREMVAEIEAADRLYRPSEFWRFYNDLNVKQFEEAGLANFKLTANQNYHNFTPHSWRDPKIRRLFSLWLRSPSLRPFLLSYPTAGARVAGNAAPVDQRRMLGMTRRRMLLYRMFLGLVWWYSERVDHYGVLSRIEEPELGNPIRVRSGGKLVSQDLATSSREFNAIMDAISRKRPAESPLAIAELGAGYGRLAHVFLEMTPCRYFIFDIPPALHASQWYLTNLLPSRKVFRFRRFEKFSEIERELEHAQIGFFTANQIAKFPNGYFDLSLSVSSLHEMRFEQIENYLSELTRIARDFLYIKQYHRYPNAYDKIVVERDAYKVPPDWETVFERTEPVYTDFFELMLKRRNPVIAANRSQ